MTQPDSPDFRALCAELIEWLILSETPPWEVIDQARTALATPPPGPPTNDELNALWNCCGTADEYGHHEGNIFEFARAALERWGHG